MLLAVEKAAERREACPRRSAAKRKHGSETGHGHDSVGAQGKTSSPTETLLKVARAASQSHLLPLPAPASLSVPNTEITEVGRPSADAGALRAVNIRGKPAAGHGMDEDVESPSALVTAGLVLDSFIKDPATVRRSVREAMQQRRQVILRIGSCARNRVLLLLHAVHLIYLRRDFFAGGNRRIGAFCWCTER